MKFNDAKIAQIQAAVDAGTTAEEISARFGVHIKTAKNYLRGSNDKRRAYTERAEIDYAIENGATAQELSIRFSVCLKTAKTYIRDWCRLHSAITKPSQKAKAKRPGFDHPQEPLIVREWMPEWQRVYLNRHPRRDVEYRILEVRL